MDLHYWYSFLLHRGKRLILLMELARNKNLLNSNDCNKIERICNFLNDIVRQEIKY